MKQVGPDLWETEAESPAPGLSTHSYLWTSPGGNVLFYNTTLDSELDRIAELGGVASQYLSHQDEIAPSLRTIKKRFGSTLHCSAAESAIVAETCPVDGTFARRQNEPYGFEVIPTPGHTPGSTCFVVTSSDDSTYLFTGDTMLLDAEGKWFAGYIDGMSDRDALNDSLRVLADLTPDVVVSSGFLHTGATTLGRRPWADCVEEALHTLQAA